MIELSKEVKALVKPVLKRFETVQTDLAAENWFYDS